jgi:hypothetical protein
MGSQGRGVSLGVVGDSDGWGPDDRTSDAPPPSRVSERGGLPPAPRRAMTQTVRIRSGQVIGVISRLVISSRFEATT